MDLVAGRSEIGFSLGRAYWGMGYMEEALQALIGYSFSKMDFRRIEADVDPRNLRSIHLLERLGFQKEGNLRQRWVIAGETQDSLFYGLLKKEWDGRLASYEYISTPQLRNHVEPSLGTRNVGSHLRRWARSFW